MRVLQTARRSRISSVLAAFLAYYIGVSLQEPQTAQWWSLPLYAIVAMVVGYGYAAAADAIFQARVMTRESAFQTAPGAWFKFSRFVTEAQATGLTLSAVGCPFWGFIDYSGKDTGPSGFEIVDGYGRRIVRGVLVTGEDSASAYPDLVSATEALSRQFTAHGGAVVDLAPRL